MPQVAERRSGSAGNRMGKAVDRTSAPGNRFSKQPYSKNGFNGPAPSKSAPASGAQGDKPEPEILFQKYFKSVGPRTYAAQLKRAANGNHFLVLTEGKRDEKTGDVRKTKLFVWSGDNDQVDLMKALGYQPVPLETADILPGLQTGLITAVPVSAYYALAGQFDTVAKHMLDLKWVPVVGATVITRKVWDQMTPAAREQLKIAGDAAGFKVRERARQEDLDAIEAMKKRGLIVHPVTPELEADWRRMAEAAYPKLRGTMVPAEIFDQVRATVAEYRKQNNK